MPLKLPLAKLSTLSLLLLAACQPGTEKPSGEPAFTETEILWDTWGVPHIYAPDLEGLFYVQGWAQAHNHGDLVLRFYGQARGRAADKRADIWAFGCVLYEMLAGGYPFAKETIADTLAAMAKARAKGATCLAVVNVAHSTR